MTENQQRVEFLAKKYEGLTERQLLEERTHSINMISRNVLSIKSMVRFFVWVFVIIAAIYIFSILSVL